MTPLSNSLILVFVYQRRFQKSAKGFVFGPGGPQEGLGQAPRGFGSGPTQGLPGMCFPLTFFELSVRLLGFTSVFLDLVTYFFAMYVELC